MITAMACFRSTLSTPKNNSATKNSAQNHSLKCEGRRSKALPFCDECVDEWCDCERCAPHYDDFECLCYRHLRGCPHKQHQPTLNLPQLVQQDTCWCGEIHWLPEKSHRERFVDKYCKKSSMFKFYQKFVLKPKLQGPTSDKIRNGNIPVPEKLDPKDPKPDLLVYRPLWGDDEQDEENYHAWVKTLPVYREWVDARADYLRDGYIPLVDLSPTTSSVPDGDDDSAQPVHLDAEFNLSMETCERIGALPDEETVGVIKDLLKSSTSTRGFARELFSRISNSTDPGTLFSSMAEVSRNRDGSLDTRALEILYSCLFVCQHSARFSSGQYSAAARTLATDVRPISFEDSVVSVIDRATRPFVGARWFEWLTTFVENMVLGVKFLCECENVIETFIGRVKLVALMAILNTYDGTNAGLIATIIAILQLYDLDNENFIVDMASALAGVLWTWIEAGINFLRPPARLQGPETAITTLVALFAGFLITLFGNLPGPIASQVRALCVGGITLMTLIRAFQTIYKMCIDHWHRRTVTRVMDRVNAYIITIADPTVFSSAPRVRELREDIEKTQEEIRKLMTNPDFEKYSSTLKALNASIQMLMQKVAILTAGSSVREPPLFVLLTGPAGFGKTTLAYHLCEAFAPGVRPSTFDLHNDHHDNYTGEPTCIWDEFDVDMDGRFVETVIKMVNKAPFMINCDLSENKGKLFTSSLVVATSNAETPLQPNHIRAHPFYRRMLIVDVLSRDIAAHLQQHPGVEVPEHMYKDDFSHLQLSVRAPLAYTYRGDILGTQNTRAPQRISVKGLIEMIRKRAPKLQIQRPLMSIGKLQAPPEVPQTIYIACPDPEKLYQSIRHLFDLESSFAGIGIEGKTHCMHVYPGHRVVLCPKRGKTDMYVTEVCSVTITPEAKTDLNTLLDLRPPLPSKINKHLHRHIFVSAAHFGTPPPPAMPVYHTYTVSDVRDLISVYRREYGVAYTAGWMFEILKATVRVDFQKLFTDLARRTLPEDPHAFAVKTPVGTYVIFSSYHAQIFFTREIVPSLTRDIVDVTSKKATFGRQIVNYVKYLFHFMLQHLHTVLAMTSVMHLYQQRQARPQAPPQHLPATPANVRRDFRGVALTDSEYSDWREYRTNIDPNVSVNDYIEAREYVRGQLRNISPRLRDLAEHVKLKSESEGTGILQSPPEDGYSKCSPLVRPTGDHGGWACHIGGGRWVMNAHCWREGMRLDNIVLEKINHPLAAGDVIVVRGPIAPDSFVVGTNVPVRSWDSRPLYHVTTHTCVIEEQPISGWVAMMPGGTHDGDCGRPYLDRLGHLVGIHSAVYSGSNQSVISKITGIGEEKEITWRDIPVTNSGRSLGPLPKGTAYGRSPAHPEVYPWERCEPAPYGFPDPRGLPTQERLLAWQLEPFVQEPMDLPPIVDAAARYVSLYFKDLLSFMPAVKQLCPDEAMLTMDLTTSCGPFVPGKKSEYIVVIGGFPIYDAGSAFGIHIHNTLAVASAGQPIENAYQLALKDELLPIPKCHQKKRLIWGTDCGLTLLAAMVWGDLFTKLKMINFVSPCAVGCNPHSTFCISVADKFYGKSTICLDYSKWDSTMNPRIIHAAVDILCDLAPPGPLNDSLRATLKQRPVGYFMDKKVYATRGLPSGTPGTSIVNSICHCILYTAALWMTCDQEGIAREADPLSSCPIITYGDDCIYGFNSRLAACLPSFIDSLRALGLKPTSPDKTDNFRLDGPMVFLKRKWSVLDVHGSDMIVAPLELDSILRQVVWIKGGKQVMHTEKKNVPATRQTQMQECLYELAIHGKATFNEWIELFRETANVEGYHLLDDWDSLIEVYRSRYMVGDLGCNASLETLLGGRLQAPPDQTPNPDGSSSSPANPENASGLVTGSYTATPAVVGTAGAPQPASQPLAVMGSGAQTGVPPELMGLWVASQRFSWTSQQPNGTLLGSIRLDPRIHPHLEVLSRIYAGWSGSMNVRILLSASGMYGGRILAAVLPPNIPPETVSNPTAYPCAILDARLSAPLELTIPDIRLGTYHPTDSDESTTSLSLYVNAPLLNPFASGAGHSAAVDVTVYVSPGVDFAFCILREPASQEVLISSVLGSNTSQWWPNRIGGSKILSLQLVDSVVQSWNHFECDSSTHGWGNCTGGPQWARGYITGSPTTNECTAWELYYYFPGVDGGWEQAPNTPDFFCTQNSADASNIANYDNPVPIYACYNDQDSAAGTLPNIQDKKAVTAYGFHGTASWVANDSAVTGKPMLNQGRFIFVTDTISGDVHDQAMFAVFVGFTGRRDRVVSKVLAPSSPTGWPSAGNKMIYFRSRGFCGDPEGCIIDSSQPLCLSESLMNQTFTIPPRSMAVFRLSSPTDSFEIGLRSDGYLMTGAGASTVNLKDVHYDIKFAGFTTLGTPLVGPASLGRGKQAIKDGYFQ
uniref:Genome polyprotein n=1 Tax=Ruddy turnstone calicivirus A TaxID=2212768 RepID=A0A3G1RPF3_9CALI|nr:MAG: polyprotein [Ruddy turnstone calicivirus A]